MMTTGLNIKQNEQLGITIEKMIADRIVGAALHDPSVGIDKELFDIRKDEHLIEVKSCRWRVQSRRGKDKTWLTKGRFTINLSSHEKLKAEAVKLKMIPEYIFAIYDIKNGNVVILRQRISSWNFVDTVLKDLPVHPRKDGMKQKKIPYKAIFPYIL